MSETPSPPMGELPRSDQLLTRDATVETMLNQWTCFTVTPEEEHEIIASAEIVAKGERSIPIGLVGKLLASKLVNKKAFVDTISKDWGIKELKIKILANNHFIFTFPDPGEIQRIVDMEPWNFNMSLPLLKLFEGFIMGDIGSFPTPHLWVRVSNIPSSGMISDIGFFIGNSIGECISVDSDANDTCLSTYTRIRVKFEIARPLKRITKLTLDPQNPSVGVLLRYEKLSDYCYVCGLLGHQLKDCHLKDYDLASHSGKYPFGSCLRAEEETLSLPPVDLLLHVSKSLICMNKQLKDGTPSQLKEITSHKRGLPLDTRRDEQNEVVMEDHDPLFNPMHKKRSTSSSSRNELTNDKQIRQDNLLKRRWLLSKPTGHYEYHLLDGIFFFITTIR